MKKPTTQLDSATDAAKTSAQLFDNWFDPIEPGVRSRVRDFIETMMEEELDAVLSRPRYGRIAPGAGEEAGAAAMVFCHRHGHRSRRLLGTFGPVEVSMPRARLKAADGGTSEWSSQALKAYQRRTVAADAELRRWCVTRAEELLKLGVRTDVDWHVVTLADCDPLQRAV